MIATDLTPEQIVGSHNMPALVGHIRYVEANGDRPNRKINQQMGEIITRLIEHGYRINGVDYNGKVRFMTVLKSVVQQKFEGPNMSYFHKFTVKEVERMQRNGWRNTSERLV